MAYEDQVRRNEIAKNPLTPSPFPIQPDLCGHCGSDDLEQQNHDQQCHRCGKWSELDGTPIEGNPQHRANTSVTFAWVHDRYKF